MSETRRYAEGTTKTDRCRWCGQSIRIIYHGEKANHTTEPLAESLLNEALEAIREHREKWDEAYRDDPPPQNEPALGGLRAVWEQDQPLYETAQRIRQQLSPDTCPTCGSDDPGWHKEPHYGCLDPFHPQLSPEDSA